MTARTSGTELRRWRNAIFALFLVNGITSASWFSRIPAVRDDLGASLQVMGLVVLCGAIGSIIGLASAPLLLGRFGARRAISLTITVLFLALTVAAVGSGVFGSIWLVALGMLSWGLGVGATDVMVNIEAAEVETRVGKTLMPLMHAFFSFGTVLGALLGASTAALGVGVLPHMLIAIVIGIALTLWALPGVPVRHERTETGSIVARAPWRERLARGLDVWRDPAVLLIGAGVLANGFAEGAAGDWMAIGAVDGHGFDEASGALLFGVFVGGMTLMRLIGGPIVDRWGRVATLRASALSAVIGIGLYITISNFAVLLIASALWGAGVALGFPLGMSAAADAPNGPARVGAVSIIGYGAFLVGPPMLGLLGGAFGILPALGVLLILLVGAALVAPAAREQSGSHARPSFDAFDDPGRAL